MANLQQNSFHLGGIWFHITWEQDGTRGRDQHGTIWLNRENPTCEATAIPVICMNAHSVLTSKTKGGQL